MIVNTINNPTPLGGNRGVLTAAENLLQNNERFALIIVVSTQGSTYRKPGALALVAENGATQSVVSGGCLEPALQDAAKLAIRNNELATLLLDTSTDDDLIFGSGSGCRGKMRVLIIPVMPTDAHPIYQAIISTHQTRQSLNLALVVSKPHCGNGMAWTAGQQWSFGNHASKMERWRDASTGEHVAQWDAEEPVTIATFTVDAPHRLLVIGAVVETTLLIRMACTIGWHTTIMDHRETQLASLAHEADNRVCSRPVALLRDLNKARFDAALIMSHSASIDLEALRLLAPRSERYVGLLGPPARRDELLSQLDDLQRSQLSSRLHAPLGLRLGGDGPEALALSITAELQRFFHHD